MNHWLVKSEPFVYSWEDFVKDGVTVWDGIRNYAARLHLRAMKKGDQILYYHSNEGLAIVGIAALTKEAFVDPTGNDDTWSAVEIKPLKALKKPVTLQQMKAEPGLKNMALLKIGRLSVSPVTKEEWDIIMSLSK